MQLFVHSRLQIAVFVSSRIYLEIISYYFRITCRKLELSADKREEGKESPYETIEGRYREMQDRAWEMTISWFIVQRFVVLQTENALSLIITLPLFFHDRRRRHRRRRRRCRCRCSVVARLRAYVFLRNI